MMVSSSYQHDETPAKQLSLTLFLLRIFPYQYTFCDQDNHKFSLINTVEHLLQYIPSPVFVVNLHVSSLDAFF